MRKMHWEIQSWERRRDTEKLADNYAGEVTAMSATGMPARLSHQREHDGRDRHAKPKLPRHQPDAERAERQPQPKL